MFYQHGVTAYETHTKVVIGNNCIASLPEELQIVNPRSILVITDRNIETTAFYKECVSHIERAGYRYVVYNKVEEEAPVRNVDEATELLRSEGCELIIAIGGGSAIDVCKGTAILATNGGRIQSYAGYEKFKERPTPFITIPTTAGTSSEVTAVAIIHDEETHVKMTVSHHEYLCARVAFLDSQSLASCPRNVIAQCGIDAFSHSFESFISMRANPMTEAMSLQGMRLVSQNLRAVYANSDNQMAALDLMIGSTMGGMAFTTTGCGYCHGVGRFVGPKYGVNHGTSIALVMPAVARFNWPAQPEKYRQVAEVMGVDTSRMTLREAGQAAVQAISDLIYDVDITAKLADYNPSPSDFEEIAEQCHDANLKIYMTKNPRRTQKCDYIAILEDASKR